MPSARLPPLPAPTNQRGRATGVLSLFRGNHNAAAVFSRFRYLVGKKMVYRKRVDVQASKFTQKFADRRYQNRVRLMLSASVCMDWLPRRIKAASRCLRAAQMARKGSRKERSECCLPPRGSAKERFRRYSALYSECFKRIEIMTSEKQWTQYRSEANNRINVT